MAQLEKKRSLCFRGSIKLFIIPAGMGKDWQDTGVLKKNGEHLLDTLVELSRIISRLLS